MPRPEAMRGRTTLLQAGSIAALLLMAVALVVVLVRDARGDAGDAERRRLELVRTVLAETVAADVARAEAVAGLFDASRRVEAPEFARFAGRALRGQPTLDALLYASADPAERTPIVYVATRDDAAVPGAPGTNLGADAGRMAAIRRARDTGEVQTSRPVAVLGGTGRAIAVITPVYAGAAAPATAAARRRAIQGYAVGVVRLDRLERTLADVLPPGLGYTVSDVATASPLVTVDAGPRGATGEISVAGRSWEVAVARDQRTVPRSAIAVAIGALVLSVLLVTLFRGHRPAPAPAAGRALRAAMVRLRRGV